MSVAYTPPGMPADTGLPPRDPTNVLGKRIVAYLIDWVIPVAVGIVLFITLAESLDKGGTFFEGVDMCDSIRDSGEATLCFETDDSVVAVDGGETALVFGIPILISLLNHVLLQGATGASLGKHALGLRVVEQRGEIAGYGRQLVRWLFLFLVDSQCAVVGLIVAAVTHPHRRVGDFVAGTYVIGKQDVGRPVVAPSNAPPGGDAPAPTGYGAPYTPSAPTAPPGPQSAPPQQFGAPPPASGGFGTPAAAPTAVTGTPGASSPTWDAQRNAWVIFDAPRNAWLRYDDATATWVPLD